jgi:ribosomal protein L20
MLAEIAVNDPEAFRQLVEQATGSVPSGSTS